MTPFDLIILTLVIGSASIYANRRWEAYRFQRELSSAVALAGGDGLAADDAGADGAGEGETAQVVSSPADAKVKKKRRRWFGRVRRKGAADTVLVAVNGTGEAVSPSVDPKAKKKKRGWFGKGRRKSAADTVLVVENATADAKSKKKKRGWFEGGRRKEAANTVLVAENGTGEAVPPPVDAKSKKKKRGWFGKGRRKSAADTVLVVENATADAKSKKKKRGWFEGGRRNGTSHTGQSVEEGIGDGEVVALTGQETTGVRKTLAVPHKEGDEDESGVVDRFGTGVAVMIALVLLVGVWIGWEIGVVYGEASGEQSAGLNAALNVESTLTNSSVSLYQEYRVFTEYARYQTLSDLEAGNGEGAAVSDLAARKNDDADLAAVQLPFFLTRYLTRDGYYDRPRQLGEAWAEAAQQVDLEPAPHFAVADIWQQKTELLVGLFIVLAFALLLLTLAGVIDRERKIMRYSAAALGILLLIFTVVAKFWIELG